jgi:hypothetical protein
MSDMPAHPDTANAGAAPRPRRRGGSARRRLVRAGGVVLLLIAAGGAWIAWSIGRTPAWYRPADATRPEVARLGRRIEQFVLEEVHRRPAGDRNWSIRLTNEQMNAWLAANLPAWYANQTSEEWPEEVGVPVVNANEAGVTVGARVPVAFGDRVLALRATVAVDDATVRLHTDRVSLGDLALPGPAADRAIALVARAFAGQFDQTDVARATDILFGRQAVDSAFDLADGRVVRLRAVTLESDAIVLTFITEREPGAGE